jgi:hypothetical protein
MTFPSLSRERLGGTKAGAAAFRWATSDRPARSVRLRVVPSLVGVPGPIAGAGLPGSDKGEIEHAVDVFARSPNGGLIVMSVAEPGSWDDLGSDEGGAYGCQTAGCQTWRRPRRSLERERPEEPPYRSECAIARLDLAPTIQELQATGCGFPTPHVPRLRVRERGKHKVNHSMVRCYA